MTIQKSSSRLSFGTTGGGSYPKWDRFLLLDDVPLIHIGNVCETCEFFFRHVGSGAVVSLSVASVKEQLDQGLWTIDEAALAMQAVMPAGPYTVMLFELVPQRVQPGGTND